MRLISSCRLLLVAALCFIAGCDGGYERDLDDNFVVHKSADDMVFIFRKSYAAIPRNDGFAAPDMDLVVGPAVDKYAVTEGLIVGYVRQVDNSVPYSEHSEPGWFLIDRGTGDVQAGLTAVEWEQQLSDRGVDASGVNLRSAD